MPSSLDSKTDLPTLLLVRGHPGSGKTTYAKQWADKEGGAHFENDQFFVDAKGVYTFDFSKHQVAKDWCLEQTKLALEKGQSCVVSCTFTTLRELEPYMALNAQVRIVEMHHNFANDHQVPAEVVELKKKAFEPWAGEKIVVGLPAEATTQNEASASPPPKSKRKNGLG